jgi:hypothetical protein
MPRQHLEQVSTQEVGHEALRLRRVVQRLKDSTDDREGPMRKDPGWEKSNLESQGS